MGECGFAERGKKMNDYTYSTMVIITCFIMLVLITMVKTNCNLEEKRQNYLITAFAFIIIGTASEWFVIMLREGYLQKFSGQKIFEIVKAILRLLKFVLLPTAPVIISKALFEDIEIAEKENSKSKIKQKVDSKENKKSLINKLVEFILKVYFAIGGSLIVVGFIIFNKNQPTAFFETMMNDIYITSFIISTIYLFINAFIFEKKFQDRHQIILVEILILVVIGVTIQLTNLETKTSWLTISIALVLLYLYYNLLILSYDKPTQLLNKASFNNYISNHNNENKACIVIIMDVNYFKNINDILGHDVGDEILAIISSLIKKNYQKYGKCYRIGGDEFAVILKENLDESSEIKKEFIKSLEKEREKDDRIPWISYGASRYTPNKKQEKSLEDTRIEADKRMYIEKETYKIDNPNPIIKEKCEQQKAQE
jgi:hypothetical protein